MLNQMMSRAVAATLCSIFVATSANAATPTKDDDLTTLPVISGSTNAGSRYFVAVGCDGSHPTRTARIHVIDLRTGVNAWEGTLTSRFSCLWNVVAAPNDVFVSGYIADDDGDNGDNLLVQRYRLKDGLLLWQKEFEAPNPNQDIVNFVSSNVDLQLVGSRLLVTAGTTGVANQTLLLQLNRETGDIVPADE